ncbi:ExeA family protein [Halorhodospira halophila]|uniref:AAA ATPase n=1 Tax=Halorhodospira halophila (strain DSM 244 / SL1) TaxID=349124 RepID=A1WTW0_HALHL|nr:AAA family ATPase [Halorhodospira halophila]ABM61122.1 AAA ATPase [Halorhodospira halophila SL1]MBK1730163.1 AAA family ATPase [Halorhodospira halophila]
MYLEHFGLREYPFQLTPNTGYYYGRASHQEALTMLWAALESGEGFLRVTGEVGTGKSLVCRQLLHKLGDHWQAALILNPALDPASLRQVVADELQLDAGNDCINAHELLRALHARLQENATAGRRTLLIIDEAQVMPDESLETLRLLTNLESEEAKLLQVVLLGQPELDQRLAQPHLRQLRQRCTFRYRLQPLPLEVVDDYLHHRVQTAGYRGRGLFMPKASRLIGRAGQGVPRTINTLAHKALLAAFGDGVQQVVREHVVRAIEDTETADASAIGIRRWLPGRSRGEERT